MSDVGDIINCRTTGIPRQITAVDRNQWFLPFGDNIINADITGASGRLIPSKFLSVPLENNRNKFKTFKNCHGKKIMKIFVYKQTWRICREFCRHLWFCWLTCLFTKNWIAVIFCQKVIFTMVLKYGEEMGPLEDKTPCAGSRADLKMCLLESDCCRKVSINIMFPLSSCPVLLWVRLSSGFKSLI